VPNCLAISTFLSVSWIKQSRLPPQRERRYLASLCLTVSSPSASILSLRTRHFPARSFRKKRATAGSCPTFRKTASRSKSKTSVSSVALAKAGNLAPAIATASPKKSPGPSLTISISRPFSSIRKTRTAPRRT
jgi:hypothetical protein